MSHSGGPWHRPPDSAPETRRTRTLVWLGVAVVAGLGIWELSRLFPGSLTDPVDQAYFLRTLAILALISAGVVYGRYNLKDSARNIAIWLGIAGVLVLGYTVYPQIEDAASNARSELVPGYPVNTSTNEMVFAKDSNGEFLIVGAVNGTPVRFLVDTGASDIVLSPGDAERIGIDISKLAFVRGYETANGEGRGANVTLAELQIGDMKLFNLPVSVNQTKMHNSLLGMAFLERMKSFEFRGRKLYLRWR